MLEKRSSIAEEIVDTNREYEEAGKRINRIRVSEDVKETLTEERDFIDARSLPIFCGIRLVVDDSVEGFEIDDVTEFGRRKE